MASLVGEDQNAGRIGPIVYLIRHGETSWSANGQHTSFSEILLTFGGEQQAHRTGSLLRDLRSSVVPPSLVLSSPRQRATRTAELAGLLVDETTEELAEWDYGDYEGLTTDQIRDMVPDWTVWTHRCPGGESARHIGDRADRVLNRIRELPPESDVVLVGHGHFSRVLIARWLNLEPSYGAYFAVDPGSVSLLGYERDEPQLRRLNIPPPAVV